MRQPPTWRAIRELYDRAAPGYDRQHDARRYRARYRIIDAPALDIAQAGRVLELGCGTGRLLAQARASVRIGIDVSPAMASRATQRGILALCADAHATPFASGSFDAIITSKGTFRYLDYPRAFAECARLLAPGGQLAVHQYASYTWSPRLRKTRARDPEGLHVRYLEELTGPAARSGLGVQGVHRWRTLRVWPYALAVPAWMPGPLWSHCTVIFRKPLR